MGNGAIYLLFRQAILALSTGKTKAADEYIAKYISNLEGRSYSRARITNRLGDIYKDAGLLEKAEEYYRKALSLEPGNPLRLNNLAFFLIENDRNIDEGIELINMALEFKPDNYVYLDTKGWGLYKKGN